MYRSSGRSCIHPNNFSVHIYQWAAGVTLIDSSIGLKQVSKSFCVAAALIGGHDIAAVAGNNATGYTILKLAKSIANRHYPLSYLHFRRVTQFSRNQFLTFSVFNFQKSHVQIVATACTANEFGTVKPRAVGQRHTDVGGPLRHYMAVGDYYPLTTNNKASTSTFLGSRTIKTKEVLDRTLAGGVYRHHASTNVFGYFGNQLALAGNILPLNASRV